MKSKVSFTLFLALACLAACGQKGPLVRPGKRPAETPASVPGPANPAGPAGNASDPPAASAAQ